MKLTFLVAITAVCTGKDILPPYEIFKEYDGEDTPLTRTTLTDLVRLREMSSFREKVCYRPSLRKELNGLEPKIEVVLVSVE